MKQLFFLLVFSVLVVACKNESVDNDNPETQELILKQIDYIYEGFGLNNEPFYENRTENFNELGQPISYSSEVTILSWYNFYYNGNHILDSIRSSDGHHQSYNKYNYQNNKLIGYQVYGLQSYEVDLFYIDNIMYTSNEYYYEPEDEMRIRRTNYIFSDQTHEVLLERESFDDYGNNNSTPFFKQTYQYDPNGNLILFNEYQLQTDGNYFNSTKEYTYDNKKNPLRSLSGTNYIIITHTLGKGSYSEPVFTGKNNVLSMTSINSSNVTFSKTFEYQYNEFDYPTNIIETWSIDNTQGEPEVLQNYYRTLTYY
ncbi:hypothetical protein H8K90_01535 [Winogradskyella echinorum]|uniref:YD repeat-containing protein n=1 Tax=Winogradskyella echinorum TaxID=538189 RepID=A0ABR6XX25_9FLAO|nr:hypothetical protein [Winogradskyella echinorum]MBC3845047.1 hypothetical protein [Winogradskyella echinorum]MBC5749395.1 hypothetical protein [Winogradskyella echinorum]